MKAYVRTSASDQAVSLVDVTTPCVGADEVRVDMAAFGVGIHDRYFIPPIGPFPYTIGIEGAGVVQAVGAHVAEVSVGDRVMVSSSMNPKGGTWAEAAVVDRRGVTVIPDSFDFLTAAAFPVIGSTAVGAMHDLQLHAGDSLFIAGASGAIGTLVVQMATQRGVRVAGSASSQNHDYLRSLGAELAVDYRDPLWIDQVREWGVGGVDNALAIQPGTAPDSLEVVRDGGRVITVSGDPCPPERGVTVEQFAHRQDTSHEVNALIDDITSGRVRLVLEHVYAFEDALTALDKTGTRHAQGKLVVKVNPDL